MKEDAGSVAGIIIYVAAWKGLFQILFIGEEVRLAPDSNIYVELTQWIFQTSVFERTLDADAVLLVVERYA